MTEEEAIAGIGMVDSAADQILSEIPLSRLVMEKRKKSRKRSPWVILLLILGSPIWLSLLIAAAAVLLSLYIVAWALVISFFAVDLALAAAALAALPGAVLYLRSGNPAGAAFAVGAGMVCAALAIFLTFGSFLLAKGVLFVTRKILFRIKISVAGKGE